MGLLALLFGGGKTTASNVPDDGSIQAKVVHLDRGKDFQISAAVKVTDRAGKLLEEMKEQDIEAYENGEPVHVENFMPAGQGAIRLALLIDCSPSMKAQNKLQQAKIAAEALTMLLREKNDYFGLYLFNETLLTKNQVERVPVEPLSRRNLRKIWQSVDAAATGEGSPITGTIDKALDSLAKVPGRRVMIVLTDGTESDDDPAEVDKRADEAALKAKEMGIPLYMVNLPAGVDSRRESDERMMKEMASRSGGEYIAAPDPTKLKDIFEQIGRSLQDECTFTYTSPDPVENGQTRNLSVFIRNGVAGTKADGSYNVPGVLSTGSGRSGGSRTGPGIGTIFLVLGTLLGLLFFAPLVVRRGARAGVDEEPGVAKPPSTPAVKPASTPTLKPTSTPPIKPGKPKSSQGFPAPGKGPRP
jgi:VWFA-related protein